MIQEHKRRLRKKGRNRKRPGGISLTRLVGFTVLFLLLAASVCVAGYVIFFRTVFAQEILPAIKSAIVFEEPNPPVHTEPAEPKEPVAAGVPAEPAVEPVAEHDVAKKPDLPKVAIVIDDMGWDEAIGEQLLNFPIELTYSFLPFAPHTRKLENLAFLAGKTVFLHLPLQPKGSTYNPGPGALYLHDPPEMQRAKFAKCLQEVPHAMGVNNHMGSSFPEDEPAMTNLIHEMKERSLVFVDSVTTSGSIAWQVAQAAPIKSARRSIFLDNTLDEEKICHQLGKLVQIAERQGWAIGIGHPHRVTVDAIETCGEKYRARVEYVGVKEVLL